MSLERLGTNYSSVTSDEDDSVGVYADAYLAYSWIYISDSDETLPWTRRDNDGRFFSFTRFRNLEVRL